ncbi:hypothetical protein B6N58_00980 [Legionella micdadei]|nr:hypothetical protein [Legionella micdadei]ARG96370.1 hypothetical protein B6N58_00980 [Legionella micdadei]
MTQCDSFFEGESTLDEMKNGLALILYKAEKLTYQNLSGQEGFDNYLNQYNQTKQDNTAHLEKSKSVACGKCSIL